MSRRSTDTWVEVARWVLWGLAVALYLAWPLAHLQTYAWSNDEGLYVQRAALANAGYPLYTETFLNKPPLLIWILQLAFLLFGESLAVARLTALGLSLLGLVALGAVARQLWGRWAGVASGLTLLALPEVPVRAHAVTSDLPAMAFALIALAAALSFRRRGRRAWLAASSAAHATALLIHPLLLFTALPLALILLWPGLGRSAQGLGSTGSPQAGARTGWRDLILFVGLGLALGLLVVLAIDSRAFFTWVFRFNVDAASRARAAVPSANGRMMAEYLGQQWPLVWLAVVGGAALCATPSERRGLAVAAVWFLATVATLLIWSPVWRHYLLFLALPLAMIAGGGLSALGRRVIAERGGERPSLRRTALSVLALLGITILLVARFGGRLALPLGGWRAWTPERLAARAFLAREVSAEGFVVTDDPLLAFTAGRLVPPPLTEISHKSITSGLVTAEDLVDSVWRYRAEAVLFATGRLEELDAFERWLVASLPTERHDFGPLWAYALSLDVKEGQSKSPATYVPHRANTTLGEAISLEGYALSGDELRPGEVLTTTLFWRRVGPVSEDYQVLVHLVGDEGRLWGQHDGTPLMGLYPTSRWVDDASLPDLHALALEPDAPPGRYRLLTGMYRWPSLERLPAYREDGQRWPDDLIFLTEVRVVAPADAAGSLHSSPPRLESVFANYHRSGIILSGYSPPRGGDP